MTEDDLQKQEDEQPIVPYGYTQNKIRKKKRFARALRNHFKSLFFNHLDEFGPKWTVIKGESGRSRKSGLSVQKWTVLSQTGRLFEPK